MDHIKAIIFDLDNTILDRTSTFRSFTNTLLNHYFGHLDATQNLFDRIIQLDQDGYKDKQELFLELLEELPWAEKPELAELLTFYSTEYVKNAVLMEHAREVIRHAKRKYKVGLITNGRSFIQFGKIDQLGIRNEFDLIIVSEEAGVKKPDPAIFELAIQQLNLRPDQCIFIGDHPEKDIEGAAKVGMNTIWIEVNQSWREGLNAKPLHQIVKLEELLELI
jgi:putative hydrolase of the HAD superfamily